MVICVDGKKKQRNIDVFCICTRNLTNYTAPHHNTNTFPSSSSFFKELRGGEDSHVSSRPGLVSSIHTIRDDAAVLLGDVTKGSVRLAKIVLAQALRTSTARGACA